MRKFSSFAILGILAILAGLFFLGVGHADHQPSEISNTTSDQVQPRFAASGNSPPTREEYIEQRFPGPENLSIYVSNQSFALSPVDITVYVDGKSMISGSFDVGNQHNWKEFRFSMEPGEYDLVIVSEKGKAEYRGTIFAEEEKRWVIINYWYSKGNPEYPRSKTGKGFSCTSHTDPPIFM